MSNKWDEALTESQLNSTEGRGQSEAEIAAHFGEKLPEIPPPAPAYPDEEIYAVAARVKNLAREGGGSLTPVGEILCNTYVHVILSLYNFANSLPEGQRERLKDLIRASEDMPANVISASKAQVKPQKRR